VNHIYLLGITPTPEDKRIQKTALGAEQEVPWTKYESYEELNSYVRIKTAISIEQYKGKSRQLSDIYNSFIKNKSPHESIFLIFGNEITGVSTDILKQSNAICELPMLGKKNSLNISNTVAIVLYYFLLKNLE
jgi:tRNA G18 (ribose-2'-O)-methylase SpoU